MCYERISSKVYFAKFSSASKLFVSVSLDYCGSTVFHAHCGNNLIFDCRSFWKTDADWVLRPTALDCNSSADWTDIRCVSEWWKHVYEQFSACQGQSIAAFPTSGRIILKILQWPEHAYQRNLTGIIASKFVNEANVALSNAAKSSIILVRDSLQVVGLICVLVWHDITLTLVTLVIAPAIVWLLKYISAKLRSILAGAQQNVATLLVRIKESYDARQIIKVSNTFESEIQRFKTVNDEVRSLALNMTKVSSAATPATQFIGVCGVAVVLVVAMIESQRGLLTLGEFITFLTAMMLILPPLRRLTGINSALVGISVAADSIFQPWTNLLRSTMGRWNCPVFERELFSNMFAFDIPVLTEMPCMIFPCMSVRGTQLH